MVVLAPAEVYTGPGVHLGKTVSLLDHLKGSFFSPNLWNFPSQQKQLNFFEMASFLSHVHLPSQQGECHLSSHPAWSSA